MSVQRGIILFGWLLAACAPFPPPTPTTSLNCATYTLQTGQNLLACSLIEADNWLLQTFPNEQVNLRDDSTRISLNGTMLIQITDVERRFIVLEGSGVIGYSGQTRILRAGAMAVVSFEESHVSEAIPYDVAILHGLRADLLARPIALPSSVYHPPTVVSVMAPSLLTQAALGTVLPTSCHIRADWTAEYRVQRGDNLSQIARLYGLSIDALQRGNCLDNPDRLRVGDLLRVPANTALPPTLPATGTPSAIAYRADADSLAMGECTTIRWDILNVQAVFLDGEPVMAQGSREVCPAQTTRYTLTVVYPDASQATRQLTIMVMGP